MSLFDPVPIPKLSRQEFDYNAATQLSGFGEYLGAKLGVGFDNSLLGRFVDDPFGRSERFGPLPQGQDLATSKAMGFDTDQPRLTEEQWRKAGLERDGLKFNGGTFDYERERASEFDKRRYQDSIIARYQGNLPAYIAGFGSAVLGGAASPENFIPFVGPEIRAAMAARLGVIGGHAVAGAVDATLGTALADAVVLPDLARRGEDVGASTFAMDLALGAVIGTVAGSAGGWLERRRAAAEAIRFTGVQTQADALEKASAAIDAGEPVDVGPMFRSDPNLVDRARRKVAEFVEPANLAEVKRSFAKSFGRTLAEDGGRGAPIGGERVFTSSGASVDVQYEVREASDLIASHDQTLKVNPSFPAELQPRDRTRAASGAQIADISANLEPELLGRSATADTGAPIVGPDNVVESGNARVLALKRAYDQGLPGGERYREFLKSQGFDTKGMKEPVLVRKRTTDLKPDERARFTAEANQRQTAEMGSAERARGDAAMLDDRTFGLLTTSDVHAPSNREFVKAFVGRLPPAESSGMLTAEGGLSQAGGLRIRNAILARAYGDAELLARLVEQPDSELGALGQALIAAAPGWARMRAGIQAGLVAPEGDGTSALLEASRHILRSKRAGDPLDLALTQGDIFKLSGQAALPDARAFMRALLTSDGKLRSRQQIEDMLTNYATEASKHPPDRDLLGDMPPTPAEILNRTAGVPLEERGPLPVVPPLDALAARGSRQPDLTTTAEVDEPHPSVVEAEKSYKVVPPSFTAEQASRIKEMGLDQDKATDLDFQAVEQARKHGTLTAEDEVTLKAADDEAKALEAEAVATEQLAICAGRFA